MYVIFRETNDERLEKFKNTYATLEDYIRRFQEVSKHFNLKNCSKNVKGNTMTVTFLRRKIDEEKITVVFEIIPEGTI